MNSGEIEQQLLDSAERARTQGNATWEVDVLRIHAQIRKEKPGEDVIGSERFKLVVDPESKLGVFEFNGAQVTLNRRQTALMKIVTDSPNTLFNVQDVIEPVFGRRVTYRALTTMLHSLRERVGENAIFMAHRKIVFLPNHLEPKKT